MPDQKPGRCDCARDRDGGADDQGRVKAVDVGLGIAAERGVSRDECPEGGDADRHPGLAEGVVGADGEA